MWNRSSDLSARAFSVSFTHRHTNFNGASNGPDRSTCFRSCAEVHLEQGNIHVYR
jgi:hypothetical protein